MRKGEYPGEQANIEECSCGCGLGAITDRSSTFNFRLGLGGARNPDQPAGDDHDMSVQPRFDQMYVTD